MSRNDSPSSSLLFSDLVRPPPRIPSIVCLGTLDDRESIEVVVLDGEPCGPPSPEEIECIVCCPPARRCDATCCCCPPPPWWLCPGPPPFPPFPRRRRLMAETLGAVVRSQSPSLINRSRISHENIPGLSLRYCSILFSTSWETILGLDPPMTPGRMLPVSCCWKIDDGKKRREKSQLLHVASSSSCVFVVVIIMSSCWCSFSSRLMFLSAKHSLLSYPYLIWSLDRRE